MPRRHPAGSDDQAGGAESTFRISCAIARRAGESRTLKLGQQSLSCCHGSRRPHGRFARRGPNRSDAATWRWRARSTRPGSAARAGCSASSTPGSSSWPSAESGKEFTVQEVVDRSGQSLRSFYQYFAGKHELLLALFDEAILSTADRLEEQIARQSTSPRAAAHLRRRVLPHVPARARRVARRRTIPTPVMAEFCHQLLTAHQTEAARAFVPLVTLLEKVLDDAVAGRDILARLESRGRRRRHSSTIMFNAAYAQTISGIDGCARPRPRLHPAVGLPVRRHRAAHRRLNPTTTAPRSDGATEARKSRVRSAEAFSSSRPSPNGTIRALKSVRPASAKLRRRFSMVASLPQTRTSPMLCGHRRVP